MCWRMALSWLLELLLLLRMPAECVSHVILAKGVDCLLESLITSVDRLLLILFALTNKRCYRFD